ncbi:MAG: bifunctional UDP-N-acetylglucosamine diphosphorylase/glucosamine-1-phosphate N-acetyltransferase GlmU [Desulfuromonas sp.]|nr:MAG: bifunctional UDP-N-acetylglucosamine diphosphorylase/glucosamine-1-phosphate N-acetyltransferase GlmU [Desulfuromonas sp.]
MTQQGVAAVILAAGKGTRMKSECAKVLHELAGAPMVHYPLAAAREVGAEPRVLVVGHQGEAVEAAMAGPGVSFVTQQEQLGTGHALLCAAEALQGFQGDLLLLCGDVPLVRSETLKALLNYHREQSAAVTVLTATLEDASGYGRIVREGEALAAIVEEKDADAEQKAIREINTGLYVFSAPYVFEALQHVGCDNAQGEYYLTDVVAAARGAGHRVRALAVEEAIETLGVNDRSQLAEAAAVMRQRINRAQMLAGVTLPDPAATYIDAGVSIGADSLVHPGAHLRGTTKLGRNCIVEPGVVVSDCRIGDGVHLKVGSVLEEAEVGPGCVIGPMAHLRPGTQLAGDNKIGNFVETKKVRLDRGSQASHLTYLGDAEVGKDVNFGCGTITCNYDGRDKHVTVVEDDVFVGSDVQLVAPVRIGRNALLAAGSTITKDVPADALALSRSEQKMIPGWSLKHKKSKKK